MSAQILYGPEFKNSVHRGTLGQFFFESAEKYKNRICHIDATLDKSETYGSIKIRSTRAAIAMQKRGVTSNDVITLCSANTLDNTIPIFAGFYLGTKVTNLDSSLSVRHTKHLLSITKPKLIFVDELGLDLIEKSLAGTTFKTEIVVFGESSKHSVFSDFQKFQKNEEDFKPVDLDPEDEALMFFSSGTTGLPKAITHTHRSLLWMALETYEAGIVGTSFHFTSFYWVTAFMLTFSCFMSGGKRVFARNFSIEDLFKIIEKYQVSYIFVAPLVTYLLTSFENAHKYDTSSLKVVACSGTPMVPSQVAKVNNLFKSAITVPCYGLTEIGGASTFNRETHFALAKEKLASVGKLMPGFQLKIVDPDNEKLLGCYEKGEIRLKAPSLMKGYYHADSSEVFDEEGFLKSGDIGYYDEDECLYFVERIKEMFKYQSWHIVPSAIEMVLLEHPSVKEVVVFGIPSGVDGEVPAACVVVKKGTTLTEEEVDEFLKKEVADRDRLRGGVTFVDVLPRTPTGKIVRKEVRDFVVSLTNR